MPAQKHGAGKVILASACMAILLLWMDGASHSLPLMLLIAAAALVVFIGLRNAQSAPPSSYEEQLERERQDALRWMEKSDPGGVDAEDEPS